MSLLSKVKGWLAQRRYTNTKHDVFEYLDTVQSRYEGSYQMFGDRSLIPATLQDSRFDATPGVRMELARRSRYWERNSAVMQRLSDLFEQFTVGPTGLRLVPSATDATWNEKASAWWKNWCRNPEVDSLRTFGETQSLIARTWFVDGEVFILKTADMSGAPKIQLIESHRVATPSQYAWQEGKGIIDGVEVNSVGAPVAYYVRKADVSSLMGIGNSTFPYIANAPEEFERVPASRMVHVHEAPRPGLTRGLPFSYSVLNDLHDFEDLQMEEMKAVKSAADMACVWHTKTGEAPDGGAFRRVARNIQTQDAAGNAVTKQSSITYDVTQGGRDRYLKPGEDVKQFLTERPTAATQWFYDYLLSKICAGCGISKLLVMPYSNQGTVVRSDLDTNARFFLTRSAVLANVFIDLYVWCLGWGKDWDRALMGAPKDWNKVLVRPPRSVNVDIGRNSAAMIAELEAGTRTRADIWAEQGEDWREQTEQLWVEAKFFEDMEAKYGISRDKVLSMPKQQPPPAPAPVKATNGVPKAQKIPIFQSHLNGNGNRLNFQNEKA